MSLLPPDQKALLCVLDWGLGHAARSLALARRLEAAGTTVAFASCGRALTFLCTERPDLTYHELPAYAVTYPTRSMPLNVALQLPKWLRTIWRERRCTAELVKQWGYTLIVSDNRFGCYVPGVRTVFLTHQLHPITGNRLVSWLYRRYLQRFSEFWVPDHPDQRLSGKLSNAGGYQNVHYIGWLSRLPDYKTTRLQNYPTTRLLALLSGPEPMRTQLENQVLEQLTGVSGYHVLVRGLPGAAPPPTRPIPANVRVIPFADATLLPELIAGAERILCRAGYSSLMDIYAVKPDAKLILVPTPGQTEQVYLAERESQRPGNQWLKISGPIRFGPEALDLK